MWGVTSLQINLMGRFVCFQNYRITQEHALGAMKGHNSTPQPPRVCDSTSQLDNTSPKPLPLAHNLPSKSKQQPQPAPVEPWAQYLITWMLIMLHAPWTVNQEEIRGVSLTPWKLCGHFSPHFLRGNHQLTASLAQQRFLLLRGQRFRGYSRERRLATQCWLSISSC